MWYPCGIVGLKHFNVFAACGARPPLTNTLCFTVYFSEPNSMVLVTLSERPSFTSPRQMRTVRSRTRIIANTWMAYLLVTHNGVVVGGLEFC